VLFRRGLVIPAKTSEGEFRETAKRESSDFYRFRCLTRLTPEIATERR
jgi:hypothetical protein